MSKTAIAVGIAALLKSAIDAWSRRRERRHIKKLMKLREAQGQ